MLVPYHGALCGGEILLLERHGRLHLHVHFRGRHVGAVIDSFTDVFQQSDDHKLRRLLLLQDTLIFEKV